MNLNPYIYLACEQLQNFMMEAADLSARWENISLSYNTMAGAAEIPSG